MCGYKKHPIENISTSGIVKYFFHKIAGNYSRHNLPLLLQNLSSQLSVFRSSTASNIKDDFSTAQRNKSDYSKLSGVF